MRTLQFLVVEQSLTKSGDFSNIVKGTKGYLKCSFVFKGISWIGVKAIAVFEANGKEFAVKIDANGAYLVPDEVTDFDHFKVCVHGFKNTYKIVTNKSLVEQR